VLLEFDLILEKNKKVKRFSKMDGLTFLIALFQSEEVNLGFSKAGGPGRAAEIS
jgi:hypothetical protein